MTITKENWQQNWASLPVKSDTPSTEIFQLGTPALSQLGVGPSGGMYGITVLKALITQALEFLSLDRHAQAWNPDQITACANIIYSEYYWLNLAELKQFFNRLQFNYYSDNKIMNPSIFCGFIRQYAEEMQDKRYDFFSVQSQKITWQPPADPIPDERFNELMNDVMKAIGAEPEKSIAEKMGGQEQFEQLQQRQIEMAKQLGVPDSLLETLKNKRK